MTEDREYTEGSGQKVQQRSAGCQSEEETGWDRIRSLFQLRYGEPLPEEVKDFPTVVITATGVGFLFGGMLGSRFAADKFIAMNHHSKFSSTMQAQRQLHSAAILGFARHGCKWGWKMGAFAGIFSGTTILLTSYRDKDDALNYIAAGGVTGGAFRLNMGLMPTLAGSVLGMLITFPFALLIDGLGRLFIGTEEKRKMREKLSQARKERWRQKLDATSVIIDEIEQAGSSDGLRNYYSLGSNKEETRSATNLTSSDIVTTETSATGKIN